MKRVMLRMLPPLMLGLALPLAACGISGPASVSGLSRAVGDDLPGAQGKAVEDQDKIDLTMARLCRNRIVPREACDAHTVASAERRWELAR